MKNFDAQLNISKNEVKQENKTFKLKNSQEKQRSIKEKDMCVELFEFLG